MNPTHLNELSDHLLALKAQKHSFALVKLPLSDAILFFTEKQLSWQNLQNYFEDGFIVAPFLFGISTNNTLFFSTKNKIEIDFSAITSNLETVNQTSDFQSPDLDTGKVQYKALVANAVEHIKLGKALKVVTSRIKKINKPTTFNPLESYLDLCKKFPKTMVAWVYASEVNLEWMGASPESLLSLNNSVATSMSLAGTRSVAAQSSWGEKELAEQSIVTDYLKSIYQKYCSEVTASQTETLPAGIIEHLLTRVSGKINSPSQLLPLLLDLHPTPAVGAMPKTEIDFITQNEAHDRKLYAGFWGLVGPDSCNLFVNLRCFEITESELIFYAGGGITGSSDPEAEWIETERKIANTQAVVLPNSNQVTE
ncbi:MAG: chorismate-binding protein [Flexibacteraceae bacterium]